MIKPRFFALFIFFKLAWIGTITFGQTTDSSRVDRISKNFILVTPQYLIMDGLRLDYDRGFKNSRMRFGTGVMFFHSGGGNIGLKDFEKVTSASGFGFVPNLKIEGYRSEMKNLSSGISRLVIYLEVAPQFQSYQVNHESEVPMAFVENGITYYEFERGEVRSSVLRAGLNLNIGWQITFEHFVMDIYTGMGYRRSYADQSFRGYTWLGWESILYTGFLVNAGVKFGVVF